MRDKISVADYDDLNHTQSRWNEWKSPRDGKVYSTRDPKQMRK